MRIIFECKDPSSPGGEVSLLTDLSFPLGANLEVSLTSVASRDGRLETGVFCLVPRELGWPPDLLSSCFRSLR
jgi:hypothetical protein